MKKFKVKGNLVVDIREYVDSCSDLTELVEYLEHFRFKYKSEIIVITKELVPNHLFEDIDNTGSKLLERCRNYNLKLVIVGDFESDLSTELEDFIYKCNNGKNMYLVNTLDEGIKLLEGIL